MLEDVVTDPARFNLPRGSLHPAICVLSVLTLLAMPLSAQTVSKKSAEQIQTSYEAHKGDFDYLLGDWAFSAKSREFGEFKGFWSAVRLSEGQILDEYRVVDEKNDTIYVTTTIRNYNGVSDQWELIGMDRANGLQDFGTARRVGAEMRLEQRFNVAQGTPRTLRIRYYNVQGDRFSWAADRSDDGGKSWIENFQTIEARRIGKPRSMEPLAKPR
jgi:hypothetical protein